MNSNERLLAKKYAVAWLNCFESQIDRPMCERMKAFGMALKEQLHGTALLKLPFMISGILDSCVELLFKRGDLPNQISPLLGLLKEHQRLFLLPEILTELEILYDQRHNIAVFNIVGSHALPATAVARITQFLHHKTGQEIIVHVDTDPSLIAGLRLRSDHLLWEYSIKQRLRALRMVTLD
jgi:F0F1-type ATP synthase delta subunit